MSTGVALPALWQKIIDVLRTKPPFDDPSWGAVIQPGAHPTDLGALEQNEACVVCLLPLLVAEEAETGFDESPQAVAFRADELLIAFKAVSAEGRVPLLFRMVTLAQAALGIAGTNLSPDDTPNCTIKAYPTAIEIWPRPDDPGAGGVAYVVTRFTLEPINLIVPPPV